MMSKIGCCASETSAEEVSGLVEEGFGALPGNLARCQEGKAKKLVKSGKGPQRRQRPQKIGINLGCMKGCTKSRLPVVLGCERDTKGLGSGHRGLTVSKKRKNRQNRRPSISAWSRCSS